MLHVSRGDDNADIEALAKSVGHLGGGKKPQYRVPTNLCALCQTPTGGVLCTPCATK